MAGSIGLLTLSWVAMETLRQARKLRLQTSAVRVVDTDTGFFADARVPIEDGNELVLTDPVLGTFRGLTAEDADMFVRKVIIPCVNEAFHVG